MLQQVQQQQLEVLQSQLLAMNLLLLLQRQQGILGSGV
jgi:hypothetical protein